MVVEPWRRRQVRAAPVQAGHAQTQTPSLKK